MMSADIARQIEHQRALVVELLSERQRNEVVCRCRGSPPRALPGNALNAVGETLDREIAAVLHILTRGVLDAGELTIDAAEIPDGAIDERQAGGLRMQIGARSSTA